MEFKVHQLSTKEHFEIAKKYDKKYSEEKDSDKKKAFRIVAAQNFFYAIVNSIEGVFAKEKGEHSFNHENRYRKFMEYRSFFDDDVAELYPLVDRNERNKVAYRGENGKMYDNIKKLALKFMGDNVE